MRVIASASVTETSSGEKNEEKSAYLCCNNNKHSQVCFLLSAAPFHCQRTHLGGLLVSITLDVIKCDFLRGILRIYFCHTPEAVSSDVQGAIMRLC